MFFDECIAEIVRRAGRGNQNQGLQMVRVFHRVKQGQQPAPRVAHEVHFAQFQGLRMASDSSSPKREWSCASSRRAPCGAPRHEGRCGRKKNEAMPTRYIRGRPGAVYSCCACPVRRGKESERTVGVWHISFPAGSGKRRRAFASIKRFHGRFLLFRAEMRIEARQAVKPGGQTPSRNRGSFAYWAHRFLYFRRLPLRLRQAGHGMRTGA